MGSILTSRNR